MKQAEIEKVLRAIAEQFDEPERALEILQKHSRAGVLRNSAKQKINMHDFLMRQILARRKRERHCLGSPVKILQNELAGDSRPVGLYIGRGEPTAGMDIRYGGCYE